MMRALLGAFQFLTIVPVRGETAAPGRAALFFPLVGAGLGAAGAGVYLALIEFLPAAIAALGTLVFWAVVTGGLHEDALADVADAFGMPRSPERILAIMKDSNIGAFGALALLFSALVRWQSVTTFALLPHSLLLAAFVASQTVPRAAMVALAWTSRPAGRGLGYAFCSTLSTRVAVSAILEGAAAAFACGLRIGVILAAGTYFIVRAARWLFHKRIGGVTGDCIGATNQVVEIFALLLFTCRSCIW
ncbi:MAG: adenosylcobinamide-GDP ribazoletransferase [Bryobacteraceae bacterium]